MIISTDIAVLLVALLHVYLATVQTLLWDKPTGLRLFGINAGFAKSSKAFAISLGAYNGFLAAGLLWGLVLGVRGDTIKIFFLTCVAIAGVLGSLTLHRRIFWLQGFSGMVALLLVLKTSRIL